MNEGELIDEFTKPVMDAEAERELVVVDEPEAPIVELKPTVTPDEAPTFDAAMSGLEGVSEAATHAETIIEATPEATVAPEVYEEEPVRVAHESRLEELEDDRYQALEDDREQATEEALREYGIQREEELESIEAADHEK